MSDVSGPDFAARIQTDGVMASVGAALNANDIERAERIAEDAVASGLEHPLLFNLAASVHEKRHEYPQAISLLQRGLAMAPGDLNMLTALGLCLNKVRRSDQALGAFDAVLSAHPDFAPAHYGKGVAFLNIADFEAARRHFHAAADLLPGYAEPVGSLAALEVRLGNNTAARPFAERALAMDPNQVAARNALATCELEAGETVRAEALARGLVNDPTIMDEDRAAAGITLGDALDREGRADEAFAAYEASKAVSRRLNAPEFERPGVETYTQSLNRMFDLYSGFDPKSWNPARPADESGAAGHAFVMGFARSGTTLLETVLATHPAIVSLDESDALRRAAEEAIVSNETMLALASLDAGSARRRRSVYWARVAGLGIDVKGKTFIDKGPFHSGLLPVVAALFPDSRILFAIRDPRDVVLSCFRRSFTISASTFQFTTLERTARCYDALMRLSMLYREKLPLNLREVRYERLVEDFETEARATADFLEVEWTPEMREFAATARRRPSGTPSARQLARGLYSGEGQWRPYAKHLEPVLPILEPWIERLGYAPS